MTSPRGPLDEVLIPAEAAALLGVTQSYVHRLVDAGELTARRATAGGRSRAAVLILRASVLAHAKRRRARGRPTKEKA